MVSRMKPAPLRTGVMIATRGPLLRSLGWLARYCTLTSYAATRAGRLQSMGREYALCSLEPSDQPSSGFMRVQERESAAGRRTRRVLVPTRGARGFRLVGMSCFLAVRTLVAALSCRMTHR